MINLIKLLKNRLLLNISNTERDICNQILEELTNPPEKIKISQTVFLGEKVFNYTEVAINKNDVPKPKI